MSDYSLIGPLWTLPLTLTSTFVTYGEPEGFSMQVQVTTAKHWSRDLNPSLSDSKTMFFPSVLTQVLLKS